MPSEQGKHYKGNVVWGCGEEAAFLQRESIRARKSGMCAHVVMKIWNWLLIYSNQPLENCHSLGGKMFIFNLNFPLTLPTFQLYFVSVKDQFHRCCRFH